MKTKNSFHLISAFMGIMLAFVLSSCAGESITYTGTQQDGVSYSFDNDKSEAIATGYYVKDGKVVTDIVLPEYVEAGKEQFKVVGIADRAFVGGPFVSLTVCGNVRSIGNQAFADCNDIRTVRLQGERLPLLPENAFEQTVYDNARLIVNSGVDVKGTGWEKFANVSDK